jgi:hypothetical protein
MNGQERHDNLIERFLEDDPYPDPARLKERIILRHSWKCERCDGPVERKAFDEMDISASRRTPALAHAELPGDDASSHGPAPQSVGDRSTGGIPATGPMRTEGGCLVRSEQRPGRITGAETRAMPVLCEPCQEVSDKLDTEIEQYWRLVAEEENSDGWERRREVRRARA